MFKIKTINHCTQYLMPANKNKSRSRTSGPWDLVPSGYRDPGTLSLQVIGTLGPCPFRLSGPWDLVPSGSWDHICPFRLLGPCPKSLKGQGPKVPIAARDKVPWSQEPEGTRSQGPDNLKGQGPRVPKSDYGICFYLQALNIVCNDYFEH